MGETGARGGRGKRSFVQRAQAQAEGRCQAGSRIKRAWAQARVVTRLRARGTPELAQAHRYTGGAQNAARPGHNFTVGTSASAGRRSTLTARAELQQTQTRVVRARACGCRGAGEVRALTLHASGRGAGELVHGDNVLEAAVVGGEPRCHGFSPGAFRLADPESPSPRTAGRATADSAPPRGTRPCC